MIVLFLNVESCRSRRNKNYYGQDVSEGCEIVRGQRSSRLVGLMIVLGIIATIAAFAIPNIVISRRSENEAGAIRDLRNLVGAQAAYMSKYDLFGSLTELYEEGFIEQPIKDGLKGGYYFGEIPTDSEFTYCFGAVPVNDGRSGTMEYIITHTGTLYEANLKSTKTSAGINWTPRTGGTPSQFTTNPKDDPNWTAVHD